MAVLHGIRFSRAKAVCDYGFQSIKEQVESFNTLFDRLTQPEIEDFEVPHAQQAEQEQTSGSHAQPRKAIKDLQALLLWLVKLTSTTCSGSHDVLLQLPEWDPTSSCEHFREPHLDLYLSRCEPSGWQKSRLHELADRYVLSSDDYTYPNK